MEIAVFFIVYFVLLVFGATPLIFCIAAAAFTIPLFFGGVSDFGLMEIVTSFVSGSSANNTGLTIILFIVAGDLMSHGKITDKIFSIFAYFFGKKKGFMPILSILTCAFYGAISGSGPATTAAVGAMCYPVLVELGYDKLFSAAILVSAGCLGMVIPPSVPVTGVTALSGGLDLIVLYKLAAVAGLACAFLMMVYSYFYCRRHGNGDQQKIDAWVDNLRAKGFGNVFKESIWALLTPVVILGSIFSGIADTAQAAALSIVYALIVSVFIYKSLKPSEILGVMRKSLQGGASMLLMVAFANTFSSALTSLNLTSILTAFVQNAGLSGSIIMIGILIYMLIMGAVGAGASVTIVIPLAYPLMIAAGLEPFTCCIAVVIMQAVGLTTPPIGLCLFVMTGMAKCNVTEMVKPLLPYITIMVLVVLFLVFFPDVFSGITAGGYIPIP